MPEVCFNKLSNFKGQMSKFKDRFKEPNDLKGQITDLEA